MPQRLDIGRPGGRAPISLMAPCAAGRKRRPPIGQAGIGKNDYRIPNSPSDASQFARILSTPVFQLVFRPKPAIGQISSFVKKTIAYQNHF
jgi:hypothetical protein